jgi:hypothetical protein
MEKNGLVTYSLGHTDTSIADGKSLSLLVGDDVDAQVLARVELAGVGKSLIADLVKGIRRVGDEFSEENLLVGVDSVDDQREQLRDLSLELECLGGHVDGCDGRIGSKTVTNTRCKVKSDCLDRDSRVSERERKMSGVKIGGR